VVARHEARDGLRCDPAAARDRWIAFGAVGSGFMPAMDEGGFILDYFSTPGTALTETDRLLRQVEGHPQSHARGGDVVRGGPEPGSAATSPRRTRAISSSA